MNEPTEYTINTDAGEIVLKVTGKEVSETTKGYIRLCHEAISGVAEGDAGPRHIPLRERLVKLFAVFADTRAQFSRVLPSLYRVAPLNEQASKIVGRLLSVQRSRDVLQDVNNNQYRQLQATVDALNECCPEGRGEAVADRVKKVCAKLREAMQANAAWADIAGTKVNETPASMLQAKQNEIDTLRALHENQKNTIARYQKESQYLQGQLDSVTGSRDLYKSAVSVAHHVLDCAGVANTGGVAARIEKLLKQRL
jgi:hypothetical protein